MSRRRASASVCAALVVSLLLLVLAPDSIAHRGFTEESLKGRWGFSEEFLEAGSPGAATGIFRFDGRGGCTAEYAWGGGATGPNDFIQPQPCDYTIDQDGKGTITAAFPDIRFVLVQHGTLIRYAWCCERGYSGRGEMNRM